MSNNDQSAAPAQFLLLHSRNRAGELGPILVRVSQIADVAEYHEPTECGNVTRLRLFPLSPGDASDWIAVAETVAQLSVLLDADGFTADEIAP